MRVVFNGNNIGSAYVQYIAYSECQQTETYSLVFLTIKTLRCGKVLKKWFIL
jgi:hypothetical protein